MVSSNGVTNCVFQTVAYTTTTLGTRSRLVDNKAIARGSRTLGRQAALSIRGPMYLLSYLSVDKLSSSWGLDGKVKAFSTVCLVIIS